MAFRRAFRKTLTAVLWFSLGGAPSSAIAQDQTISRSLELCSNLVDEKSRLLCYQRNLPNSMADPRTSGSAAAGSSESPGWRLVRVHGPAGDPDAVWIMRSVELSQSDIGIAGIAFRCGNPVVEMLVILLAPLPPRSHTTVGLDIGKAHSEFSAKLVPPETALLLPPDASLQTIASSHSSPAAKLQVSIAAEQSEPVHGEVLLSGLNEALGLLKTSCQTQ
jgi:hypothetical protein